MACTEEFASVLNCLSDVVSHCEEAVANGHNKLATTIKEQAQKLLRQITTDPVPPDWQNRCIRHLDRETDPVLRFLVSSRTQIKVDLLDRPTLVSEYGRRYRAYEEAVGKLVPSDVKQAAWQCAQVHYQYDRSDAAADDFTVYYDRRRQAQGQTSSLIGFATGIEELDTAMSGIRGLNVLGGVTGCGKTTLAASITCAALRAHQDLCALFLTLEMPKDAIIDRLRCAAAQVTYRELLSGDRDTDMTQRIREADRLLLREVLPRLKFRQSVPTEHDETFAGVVMGDLKKLFRDTGARQSFIVVDSFRKIPLPTEPGEAIDPDTYRLSQLEWINKRYGGAVLVIADLRKDSAPGEPTLNDLLGSVRIGYETDAALILSQAPGQQDADVRPARQRGRSHACPGDKRIREPWMKSGNRRALPCA